MNANNHATTCLQNRKLCAEQKEEDNDDLLHMPVVPPFELAAQTTSKR
jgi:hypothetical protein